MRGGAVEQKTGILPGTNVIVLDGLVPMLEPVDRVTPDAGNPRVPKRLKELVASIRRFGVRWPIVANKRTGVIEAGHQRYAAMRELGATHVPVLWADDDGATARAFNVADNRVGDVVAEWDEEALLGILRGLEAEGETALLGIGWDERELERLLAKEDGNVGDDGGDKVSRSDELQAKWGTSMGQLWELGEHRLLCGDSTDLVSAQRVMDGDVAELMFTDPPYGVAYVGCTKDALKIESDDVDEETLSALVGKWFDVAEAVTRPGAYWLATVPPGPLHVVFLQDWKQRGILRQVMVWVKDAFVLGHSEYHYRHEPILFGWRPGERTKNQDRTRDSVWEFDRPKASREHPTMKPIQMWCYGITNHSQRGGVVYEPFSGSGTCLLACEELGRRCRAIEMSPAYVAVALERWAEMTGKTPVLVQ